MQNIMHFLYQNNKAIQCVYILATNIVNFINYVKKYNDQTIQSLTFLKCLNTMV